MRISNLRSEELIKEKESFSPSTVTTSVLLNDHRILHGWWLSTLQGIEVSGWSKDDIFQGHALAAREMIIRGIGHNSPLPVSLEKIEAMCNQCGGCCHNKTRTDGIVTISNEACEHLTKSNTCSVYKDRLKVGHCTDISTGILIGALPDHCSYIKNIEGYISPQLAHNNAIKEKLELNLKILEKHRVKGTNTFNYLTGIENNKGIIPTGKAYNSELNLPIGAIIKIGFSTLNKFKDPNTGKIWYNMWNPKVLSEGSKQDSLSKVNHLVDQSNGEISQKQFPSLYESIIEMDDQYTKEFKKLCLAENSEEFNLALNSGWINKKEYIPNRLSPSNMIRNKENFLLRKDVSEGSVIVLRDKENKVLEQKTVELSNG